MHSTESAGIGWVIVVSKVWHGYENTHSVWAMGCAGMGTVFEIVTHGYTTTSSGKLLVCLLCFYQSIHIKPLCSFTDAVPTVSWVSTSMYTIKFPTDPPPPALFLLLCLIFSHCFFIMPHCDMTKYSTASCAYFYYYPYHLTLPRVSHPTAT